MKGKAWWSEEKVNYYMHNVYNEINLQPIIMMYSSFSILTNIYADILQLNSHVHREREQKPVNMKQMYTFTFPLKLH